MSRRAIFYLCILAQIVFLCVMIRSNARVLATGTKVLLETVPVDPHDLFRGEYAALRYRISSVEFPPGAALRQGDTVYITLARKGRLWEFESAGAEKPAGDGVFIRGTVQRVRSGHITVLGDFSDVTEKGWLAENPDAARNVARIDYREKGWKRGDTVFIPFERFGQGRWTSRIWGIDKDKEKALGQRSWRTDKDEKRVLISATVASVEEKQIAEVEYGIESYYVPEGRSRELERPRGGGRVTVEAAVDSSGDSAISRLFIDGTPIDF